MSRLYITLFDRIQFLSIIDLTDTDKAAVWSALKDQSLSFPTTIREMLNHATRSEPSSGTELWTFQSDYSLKDLWEIAKTQHQDFIDVIHQEGAVVFMHKVEDLA